MATLCRAKHRACDQYLTQRHWQKDARTFCYHTHIAISEQPEQQFTWLAELLFNAANMSRQPWYPHFHGGLCVPAELPVSNSGNRHQVAWGRFDLGLTTPRYYRQLLSLSYPSVDTAVIAARSVNEGPMLPKGAILAYTLAPNGEVLHWENGRLHWHHICCTPGAAILPGRMDRWLINTIRALGLDFAERKTYREEAKQMQQWLQTVASANAVPAAPDADKH